MPSTFSPSLKIELIANGEQAGTWGQTTNNNLGTLIEQAIAGVDTIDITGVSTYTLSNYNGIADEARNAAIIFTGTLSANCAVTTPAVEKLYIISNQTTGGYYVTVSTGSGNTVAIGSNTNQLIYCDGTNYNAAISNINNVVGDLTVTGSIFLGGNLTSTTGNLTLNAYSNVVNMGNNTGALIAPIGTTAQRPTALVSGMVRWNTTTSAYEVYNGSIWINLLTANYVVSYLMVAGGGAGGGTNYGGGGGGGGLLQSTTTLASGTSYSIVIGAGGASSVLVGANGSNSTAFSLTAVGGGGGGGTNTGLCVNGVAGGSGGGGSGGAGTGSNSAGGSATSGQGFAGGSGLTQSVYAPAGGGGGAGGAGGNATSAISGAGGSGLSSSIIGTLTYYAGGGGGSNVGGSSVGGAGGAGGGGQGGGSNNSYVGQAGTVNSGGGAGGTSSGANGPAGGSGIVIISYPGIQRGSGGTITTASNTTIHTFTSSGTYIA